MTTNPLKQHRESLLMSKAELERKADASPLTISRIESDHPCLVEAQIKILLALGLKVSDRDKVFRNLITESVVGLR
jgi:DNA-binding XRE family transcriptional regulator